MKENNEKELQGLSEEELKNVTGGIAKTPNCKEVTGPFSEAGKCEDGYFFDNGKCCK